MFIVDICPNDLPPAQVNIAYGFFLQVFGGVPPITFKALRGEFPNGIYLSPEGHLSGTTHVSGHCMVTVRATDAEHDIADRVYKFYVEPQPRPFPPRRIKQDSDDASRPPD